MNFFESFIQANIRKEAENISSAAFDFLTDKHVNKPFEEEIKKILFSDLSSKIEGYEFGMIPLMLAMITVKKHVDVLPKHAKKEDFVDWKLNEKS